MSIISSFLIELAHFLHTNFLLNGKLDIFFITLVNIFGICEMIFGISLDKRRSEITNLEIVVLYRYHRKVSKYIARGNKSEIWLEDIEKAVEAVMNCEKKLR